MVQAYYWFKGEILSSSLKVTRSIENCFNE